MRERRGCVEDKSDTDIEDITDAQGTRGRTFEVRVPASTSNLGAGFDCFGLALQLYLTVRARIVPNARVACRVRSRGEGAKGDASFYSTENNLIFRAMRYAAQRENLNLPNVRLAVYNELPLGRGLGSSAAAIVAGISLCSLLCERELSASTILNYASEMECHADNVAAALYGGWVVTCIKADKSVLALKKPWPRDVKIIVVSPDAPLKTADARSALPHTVTHESAVYNLQRAVLFEAALEAGAYDLIWEAMKDQLHQSYRQDFVPGLADALATPRQPGLIGLALSGSGPSIVALACDHYDEIGETIAGKFRAHSLKATVLLLEVDNDGRKTEILPRRRRTLNHY
jgi:homoserine kinase